MKRGFTLLEMLVVIGILGILSAVMLKVTRGSSESARATKCLANMHVLATACQSVAMTSGHYPPAGSWEYRERLAGTAVHYHDVKGWISWASQGAYPAPAGYATTSKGGASWMISTYFQPKNKQEREWRRHSLTNGAIWRAVNANSDTYLCPSHLENKNVKNAGLQPLWSYVMNSDFGWAKSASPKPRTTQQGNYDFGELDKAERKLLLAEIPFNEENAVQHCEFQTTAGTKLDPTLQYGSGFSETIGANHKKGRKWYAHVCFADGHAESIEIPDGMSQSQLQNLTKYLCQGKDIVRKGNQYEELTQ